MAQETNKVDAKAHQVDEDELIELQKLQPVTMYDVIRKQTERFACTRLGQFVCERGDRSLKMLEDTTKWSLPQEKSACTLERPLPWAPFLLMIMLLRLTRIWLSIGALMIGNGPVRPADMIYFIQTRRRKLRAIRVHGLKVMRQRQQEASAARSGKHSYRQKLTHWLSQAICRPGVQRAHSGRLFNMQNAVAQPTAQLNKSAVSKRPRDEDCNAELNMTIDEMLAKYANENSEDDSDFVPNAEDETNDESSSESSSSAESDSSEHGNGHDDVIINENGSHKVHKPLVDIKAEPYSDLDNSSKDTKMQNGNGDKEQSVGHAADAAPPHTPHHLLNAKKDEDWKSTPGHLSAALVNTQLFNNTAAAATSDAEHTDTDSSASTSQSGGTVYSARSYQSQDADIAENPKTLTPASIHPNNPSSHPSQIQSTIDTLTPATSSEDIFYSPIGSPIEYNPSFAPQSILKNSAVKLAHSTPTSQLADIPTEKADKENAGRMQQQQQQQPQHPIKTAEPSLQQSSQPQQPQLQQQYQRQHQQQNHRFRGRNRR